MKKYKERVDKNSTLTMQKVEPQDPSGTRPLPHSRLYLIAQNAFLFAMFGSLGRLYLWPFYAQSRNWILYSCFYQPCVCGFRRYLWRYRRNFYQTRVIAIQ